MKFWLHPTKKLMGVTLSSMIICFRVHNFAFLGLPFVNLVSMNSMQAVLQVTLAVLRPLP
jgi:hypothetical protein